jgi:RNA polymerase-binding transcription factor DksA
MLLQAKRAQLVNAVGGRPIPSQSPPLEEIESALGRIREGSYGACIQCGRMIERERLKQDPTEQRCRVHGER